uniref:Uncharacterized protein n=1 Tax=Gnetum luofuense TaxID=288818 RepID=A0A7D6J975_9SPER|nr:hypothetical protein [Gnetum luofuense]QLO81980.1 hypothetical protein [Gnetum luofuense]
MPVGVPKLRVRYEEVDLEQLINRKNDNGEPSTSDATRSDHFVEEPTTRRPRRRRNVSCIFPIEKKPERVLRQNTKTFFNIMQEWSRFTLVKERKKKTSMNFGEHIESGKDTPIGESEDFWKDIGASEIFWEDKETEEDQEETEEDQEETEEDQEETEEDQEETEEDQELWNNFSFDFWKDKETEEDQDKETRENKDKETVKKKKRKKKDKKKAKKQNIEWVDL